MRALFGVTLATSLYTAACTVPVPIPVPIEVEKEVVISIPADQGPTDIPLRFVSRTPAWDRQPITGYCISQLFSQNPDFMCPDSAPYGVCDEGSEMTMVLLDRDDDVGSLLRNNGMYKALLCLGDYTPLTPEKVAEQMAFKQALEDLE